MTAARPVQQCTVDNCEARAKARGWCNRHYKAYRVHGSPTPSGVVDRPMGKPRRHLTDDMLEDLQFMADHGENSYGAAARISRHTDAARPMTRDRLLDNLRNAGRSALGSQLVAADPMTDKALSDPDNAARGESLRAARAVKAAAYTRRAGA